MPFSYIVLRRRVYALMFEFWKCIYSKVWRAGNRFEVYILRTGCTCNTVHYTGVLCGTGLYLRESPTVYAQSQIQILHPTA
jgi:hypothetical protein